MTQAHRAIRAVGAERQCSARVVARSRMDTI